MNSRAEHEWQEISLIDAARPEAPIGYGIVQVGPHVRGGVPVLAIRDLFRPSVRTAHRSSPNIEARYRRSRVLPGDLLVSVKGTTGRVGLVPDGFEGNISRDIARVRLRSEHNPRFWLHLLRSDGAQSILQQAAVGTTRQELSIATLRTLRFRCPNKAEQDRLVATLDDIDDQVAALERVIAKREATKQGMMQQLLTGRTRLPGFSKPWHHVPLGDLLSYEQPGRYLVASTEYADTGVPVLTAGKTFLLGYTHERHGIYDAVPVIIFDDFTTASKFVDFPFKAKSSAMKMLTARENVDLRFVYERMQLINFVVVDHKRRWIAEYSKLDVEVPEPDEQRAISLVMADADGEIGALQARLTKARAIKQGITQQLLTGRVRLPVETAS